MVRPAWETPGSRAAGCSGASRTLMPGNLELHLSCGGNTAETPTHGAEFMDQPVWSRVCTSADPSRGKGLSEVSEACGPRHRAPG